MIFIINYKTPTMTAQQFYKQALIFTDSYQLMTETSLGVEIWP